jgi:hypothetical protein
MKQVKGEGGYGGVRWDEVLEGWSLCRGARRDVAQMPEGYARRLAISGTGKGRARGEQDEKLEKTFRVCELTRVMVDKQEREWASIVIVGSLGWQGY